MPPALLFRYRSLSGEAFKFAQDIFLRKRLYMPPAIALNDLGEGLCAMEPPAHMQKTSPTKADQWALGNYGWGMQIRQRQSKHALRIASFSESCTNQLLWAHYADSHRGICIGFLTASSPHRGRAVPVNYSKSPPVWQGEDADIVKVYGTKSSYWTYEQEWRIFDDISFIPLAKKAIHTVILGARISDDDKSWVEDWIQLKGWNPVVHRSVFADDRYEMRVEPI